MKKVPKVLLIYPPNQLMVLPGQTETRRFDGSLGPLYLAGALRRAGIEVEILDANVGPPEDKLEDTFYKDVPLPNGFIGIGMSMESITQYVAANGFNIVGITSIFTSQHNRAMEVFRAVKAASPEIMVMAGGVNARALHERFLAEGFDVVCNTEGENVIVNVIRAWQNGASLSLPGTITKYNGEIVNRPAVAEGKVITLGSKPPDTLRTLDLLPRPWWEGLPWKHYDAASRATGRDSLIKAILRTAAMQTSRGCWAECTYCHISEEKLFSAEHGGIGNLRFKSKERVIEELETLKALGVGKVFFEDDTLLHHKSRMKEILPEVPGRGFQLADVNGVNLANLVKKTKSGVWVIDEEYLELIASIGLTQIVFPVESASQRIIDKHATKKLDHDRFDVTQLVKVAVKKGITCPINMMVGFPDETDAEIKETIELGRRLVGAGAPYVSFYIPIPFPGSTLYRMAIREGYLDENFDTDRFNWRTPIMKNTTVPPERIVELQSWGWHSVNPPEFVAARLAMNVGEQRFDPGNIV